MNYIDIKATSIMVIHIRIFTYYLDINFAVNMYICKCIAADAKINLVRISYVRNMLYMYVNVLNHFQVLLLKMAPHIFLPKVILLIAFCLLYWSCKDQHFSLQQGLWWCLSLQRQQLCGSVVFPLLHPLATIHTYLYLYVYYV